RPLAYLHCGITGECIRRHNQVGGSRSLADTPRRIVYRAMARAEPAAILPFIIERYAAQMGANADDDKPFRLFGAVGVRLRILERAHRRRHGFADFLGAAMADKHRLAAPFHLDALAN